MATLRPFDPRPSLTPEEKRTMTPEQVCQECPHDPGLANPCDCGIRWGRDIDGDWYIKDRWWKP